jgi:SAM-dependent methyltransferase
MSDLPRYPFPEIPLPETSNGEHLLDVGCNWGRWSIAAAKKGYKAVGIDPSLNAVLAASRIARQFGLDAQFVAADARYLPFADDAFDITFSYGVLQHFSKENSRISIAEMSRVLRDQGRALMQMPNRYGLRAQQQLWRRNYAEGEGFDVRYWTPAELKEAFEKTFGPTRMTADCYFGLVVHKSDMDLMPLKFKAVVAASDVLRRVSRVVTPLAKVADSVYLSSVNKKG